MAVPASGTSARRDGRPQHRRTYAALDLGTNNCRLLIARPDPSGNGFVIVDAFSRIVRLGEGMAASGRISDVAVERALAALSVCADKLVRRGVSLSRAVATEACRQAENGRAFVERVYRETGIALEIIDPGEEARLAVAGCATLLDDGDGPALVFDIGGGSTELVELHGSRFDHEFRRWISVPWGVVSLSESEPGPLPTAEARVAAYLRMRDRVVHSLGDFAARGGEPLRMLGTSGTVTTLASVYLGLPSYERRAVDGLRVPAGELRDICRRLASMSVPERARIPCIGPERSDLVVAGCAILEAILDLWPADVVGVADRGIREGILRSLMGQA